MLYSIIHSKRSRKNIDEVAKVLLNYYPSTFQKFIIDFNSKIEILKIFPYSYQKDYYSNDRKIQLKYNYKLVYRVKDNQVIISKIVNSKQINHLKN